MGASITCPICLKAWQESFTFTEPKYFSCWNQICLSKDVNMAWILCKQNAFQDKQVKEKKRLKRWKLKCNTAENGTVHRSNTCLLKWQCDDLGNWWHQKTACSTLILEKIRWIYTCQQINYRHEHCTGKYNWSVYNFIQQRSWKLHYNCKC